MSSEWGKDGHVESITLRTGQLNPYPGPYSGLPLGKPLSMLRGTHKATEVFPS